MPYVQQLSIDNGLNPNNLYNGLAETIANFRKVRASRVAAMNMLQQDATATGKDKNMTVSLDEDNRLHVSQNGEETPEALKAYYGMDKKDLTVKGKGNSSTAVIDVNKTKALADNAMDATSRGFNPGRDVANFLAQRITTDLKVPYNKDASVIGKTPTTSTATVADAQREGIAQGVAALPEVTANNTEALRERQSNSGTTAPPGATPRSSVSSGVSSGASVGESQSQSYGVEGKFKEGNAKVDPVVKTTSSVDNSFTDELQQSYGDLMHNSAVADALSVAAGNQPGSNLNNVYAQKAAQRLYDLKQRDALINANGTSSIESGGKVEVTGGDGSVNLRQNEAARNNIHMQTSLNGGGNSSIAGNKQQDPNKYQTLNIGGNATVTATHGKLDTDLKPFEAQAMITQMLMAKNLAQKVNTKDWNDATWNAEKAKIAKEYGFDWNTISSKGIKRGTDIGAIMRNSHTEDLANVNQTRRKSLEDEQGGQVTFR